MSMHVDAFDFFSLSFEFQYFRPVRIKFVCHSVIKNVVVVSTIYTEVCTLLFCCCFDLDWMRVCECVVIYIYNHCKYVTYPNTWSHARAVRPNFVLWVGWANGNVCTVPNVVNSVGIVTATINGNRT